MNVILDNLANIKANFFDSFNLMILGVGTVLLFLCVTIFAVIIMSKVVMYLNTIFPEAVPKVIQKPAKTICDDAAVAVAVLAAMVRK